MSKDKATPAIVVNNVSKTFRTPLDGSNSIKQKIVHFLKREKGYKEFTPLNDISFEIEKGEFFGIVGRNGSGKSTLLKTIAGIYHPDKGYVKVHGLLVPFIELGVGFNPELTGHENVYLNGAMLGFSRNEIGAMYDDIVDFAELHDFMGERLKNYSSGMQVRLAFSIAIRAQGDILLLDEVLAVGDAAFQRKCFEYFAQLKRDKKTVILVTHSMDSVERFCSRALLLNEGKILKIGSSGDVAAEYENINRGNSSISKSPTQKQGSNNEDVNDEYFTSDIKLLNADMKETNTFKAKDELVFQINLQPKQRIEDAFVGFQIKRSDGEPLFRVVTENPNEIIPYFDPSEPVTVNIVVQNIFAETNYTADVTVKSVDRTKEYLVKRKVLEFEVLTDDKVKWSLQPDYKLSITQGVKK